MNYMFTRFLGPFTDCPIGSLLGQKLGLIWLLISKLAVKVLGTVNMVLCVCTLSPLKYAKKLLKLYKNFRFSVVQLQR